MSKLLARTKFETGPKFIFPSSRNDTNESKVDLPGPLNTHVCIYIQKREQNHFFPKEKKNKKKLFLQSLISRIFQDPFSTICVWNNIFR